MRFRAFFAFIALTTSACGATVTPEASPSDATPEDSSPADGYADAAATDTLIDGASSSCKGPPAKLSLGPYPAGTDDAARAEAAITGTIKAIGAWPTGCDPGPISGYTPDTFAVDEVIWSFSFTRGGGTKDDGYFYGKTIEVNDDKFSPTQKLLVLASGGSGPACIAIYGYTALDLAKYPNAANDMEKLRAFVRDRDDYDALVKASRIVDATVTSEGPRTNDSAAPGSDYHVRLELAAKSTLCGAEAEASASTVHATYHGHQNAGIANPAGSTPPAVGAHLVFLLAGPAADGSYDLQQVFSADRAAALAALLASAPSLSL